MRITQPALVVVSAGSLELDPICGERHQLLLDWLPNVEPFVLQDASAWPMAWRHSLLATHSAQLKPGQAPRKDVDPA